MKVDPPSGHVPAKVVWESSGPIVEFAPLTFVDPILPFFCQNIRQESTVRVALSRLRCGDEADVQSRPSGFIFHMSRCGSTLVSQMLAVLNQRLILAEPDALKDVLRAPKAVSDRCVAIALRNVMSLYARALRNTGQHFIVKWTSWAVVHLHLIERAFPYVPSCFITRDPAEVMVSLLEKPTGWLRRKDRGIARQRILPVEVKPARHYSDEEFSACCLARFCEVAVNNSCDMTALDYRDLPDAVWDGLAPYFGLSLSEKDKTAMRSTARIYSKDPSHTRLFTTDADRKQAQASAAVREQSVHVEAALANVRIRLRRPGPFGEPERAAKAHQRATALYRRGQLLAALQLARSEQGLVGELSIVGVPRRFFMLTAKLLAKLRRNAEALDMYRQLLASADAKGATPNEIAGLTNAIGENQQALGLYEEAEEAFRKVLSIRMATCGPLHPNFAIALNALATLRYRRGDFLFSERLYRESAAVQEAAIGEEHPHYATAVNNLASFLVNCGRLDEALPLYQEALDIRRRVLGDGAPVYASSISNLAELMRLLGDLDLSEHLHRSALDIRVHSLGKDHYLVGCSRIFLGKVLRAHGKPYHARSQLVRAMEVLLLSVGQGFPLTRQLSELISENW